MSRSKCRDTEGLMEKGRGHPAKCMEIIGIFVGPIKCADRVR